MKKMWAIRRDEEAVSPVIGTILMVAITMILVGVLFVLVSDLGRTTYTPAVLVLETDTVSYGYLVKLSEPTSGVRWGDVAIYLSDGTNNAVWNNLTTDDLAGPPTPRSWCYGSPMALGDLQVFLNITDLAGNGEMNRGDYLTFTTSSLATFSPTARYELTVLHEQTGGSMLTTPIT